jgi:hypothetical protein
MNHFAVGLFAEIGQSASSGGQPSASPSAWNLQAAIVVGAIAFLLAVLSAVCWLVSRWLKARDEKTVNSPWGLFHELCAAQGLNHRERQWLSRLARQQGLDQPAALFVEPAWWEPDRLGPTWESVLPQLHELRNRLFARA